MSSGAQTQHQNPPRTSADRREPEFGPLEFHRPDAAWAALLALLALIPAIPYLATGQTLLGAFPIGNCENLNEWMLYRTFINHGLESGIMPAWCPGFNSGMPFIGWAHTAVFAPLGSIYFLLPYNTAAVVGLYSHLAIFAVGAYALMRMLGQRSGAAFLAAVAAMSFFALVEGDHFLPRLLSFSWAPLLFACYVGLWREPRRIYFLAALAIVGLQVLGGHPETVGREFMFLAAVGLAALIVRPRDFLARRRTLAVMAASIAGGLLLGAAQFIPAYEFVGMSTRSDPAWFSYQTFSAVASPKLLAYFLRVTVGAVAIGALAVCAGEMRDHPAIRAAALAAIAVSILSTNAFGVLRLVYPLPIAGRMMWHQQNFHFLAILAAVVIGFAFEHVARRDAARRHLLIFSGSCLIFGLLVLLESSLVNVDAYIYPFNLHAAIQGKLAPLFLAFALSAAGIVILGRATRVTLWSVLAALVFCSLYLPLFFGYHRENNSFPNFNRAYVEFFSRPRPPGRVMTMAPAGHSEERSIPFQAGFVPGVEAVDSIMTSSIRWYAEFYSEISPMRVSRPDGTVEAHDFWRLKYQKYVSRKNLNLLNLINLAYLVCEESNLKFADHYYLAYDWTPASCEGPCRRRGLVRPGDLPAIELETPAGWKQLAYLPPDSELGLMVKTGKGPPDTDPLAFTVMARDRETGRTGIAYHRVFGAGDPPGAGLELDLEKWDQRAVYLSFAATPVGRGDGRRVEIQNPLIRNPHAYFKRLDLEGVNVFANTGVLPRAFAVHRHRVIADKKERLAYLGGPEFEPSIEVLLETDPHGPVRGPGSGARETVEVASYLPSRVELAVELAAPGFVVLSDVYYPGWVAEDGGDELFIHRADHAFRAVRLDPGRHRVVFSYRPASLRIGLWCTLATLLFSVAGGVVVTLRGWYKSGA